MIYLITNKVNGHRYIGKTSQPLEKRWYQHCKNAEYGKDTYFYRAIRKYGVDSFSICFLCDGLDEEEILLITEHNPEYNMTVGGDGGDVSLSPSYQKAMEKRDLSGPKNHMWGKRGPDNPNFGKKRSAEQIEKYKASYKGKRIPVVINGVKYDSVSSAAKVLGRSERYVRLHDELNEWKY